MGYSRGVRVGQAVEIAGTTAPGRDAYEQTRFILDKVSSDSPEKQLTMPNQNSKHAHQPLLSA